MCFNVKGTPVSWLMNLHTAMPTVDFPVLDVGRPIRLSTFNLNADMFPESHFLLYCPHEQISPRSEDSLCECWIPAHLLCELCILDWV
jgi:hypothetical protein